MIYRNKKPRLYSACKSDRKNKYLKRLSDVFIICEPIFFYLLVSAVLEVSAYVLMPANLRVFVHGMAVILSVILQFYVITSSWRRKREISEKLYIEHMTYLFCKHKDFKKALMEIRDIFPQKEEKRIINYALFLQQESRKVESAMKYIEDNFSGTKVKLVHRYILESQVRQNYNPPAEILTCITTSPSTSLRSKSGKRKDRWTILLCALFSVAICVVIESLGKSSGYLSMEYDSSIPCLFAFFVLFGVFVIYEIRDEIKKKRFEKYKGMRVCTYLKDLTFFLLVMPVPKAIVKSTQYLDWSMKKKVSRLAEAIDSENLAEAYLEFGEKFHDETIKQIMEFLYAKSSEPYLAPAELTPMLRKIDEVMARETTRAMMEEKRERTSLLLAPQLASFVMLFGNILSLVDSLGREL